MRIAKKAKKLIQDPKAFIRDSTQIKKLFQSLYGDQLNTGCQDSGNFTLGPSVRLNPVSLFDGAVTVNCTQAAELVRRFADATGNDIPVVVFSSKQPNTIELGVLCADFPGLLSIISSLVSPIWRCRVKSSYRKVSAKDLPDMALAEEFEASCYIAKNIYVVFRFSLYRFEKSNSGGFYVSNNSRNQYARKVSKALGDSLFGEKGLRLFDEVVGSPSSECVQFPIDVVYTWVNHEDTDWQGLYRQYAPKERLTSDAHSLSRYINRDELKYSLRSVFQNLPWVRNIYVLTNCRAPDWFLEDRGVIWLDHGDILHRADLPTFNSHAIEACLHLIPNLSEHFIYFNDDVFVNVPMSKSDFFDPSGHSRSNLEEYGVVNGGVTEGDPDYLNAARIGAGLLGAHSGVRPTRLHEHSPHSLRVSVLTELEALFPENFKITRSKRFRSLQDLSVVSFLYHHYALKNGMAVYADYETKLIKNTTKNLLEVLQSLDRSLPPSTFCINDGLDSHADSIWNATIKLFLETKFSNPAPCEIEK